VDNVEENMHFLSRPASMKCIFSYTSTIECEIYQTCIMCCFSIMHMHMLLLLKNRRTHLVPRHKVLPRPWLHGPLQSPASMARKHVVHRAVIIPPHKRKVTPFKGEQHPQLCVPRLGPSPWTQTLSNHGFPACTRDQIDEANDSTIDHWSMEIKLIRKCHWVAYHGIHW